MYFQSFSQALAMDGHGGFVWSAYGITAFVLFILILAPLRRKSRVMRHIAQQRRRAERSAAQQSEATTTSEPQAGEH